LAADFSEAVRNESIQILGRAINSRYTADDIVWFEFVDLCGGPRSVHDYIEIARLYHAVLLGNIPRLDATRDDQARRFINLVDELYDHGVKLIISAEAPMEQLYGGTVLKKEMQRTVSRLQEMQTHEYLARPHRP
jgi:cell division protein ZapE